MKVLRRLLLIMVLAIGGIMLAGCRSNTAKPAAQNQEDVVSYSVVSGLEMLSAGSARKLSLDADAQNEQVITNDLDQINDYLGLVEKFLSSDDAAITHTEGASEREGFEKKMTISTMNLTGERTEYVLYYNETSVDVEEDDDELEVEIELEGIVVLGDVEYTLTGEKEIEQEEGEEEYSYKFEIKLDSKNWVKIEYSEELEDDEVEKSFKYEAYNNGVKKEIKIAYENEDDELKLKLYISDELELEIKQEKNELKIEYETKDPETGKKVEGEIKVRVVTDANGNTSYEYKVKEKNGGEVTYQKDRDDDDDDEEEIEVEFEGKVILNPEGAKVTFLLEGKNSQEEGETEVEYKLYQEDDDDNYILFKQETVERKQKFTYEIYFKEKTEIITKMYIGLDYENKTHIFLETEDKIKDSKAKYNIKEEDYLIGSYEIDYLDDDEEGTIKISYADGNNQYEITSDDVTIIRIKPFSGFIQTRKKLTLFT